MQINPQAFGEVMACLDTTQYASNIVNYMLSRNVPIQQRLAGIHQMLQQEEASMYTRPYMSYAQAYQPYANNNGFQCGQSSYESQNGFGTCSSVPVDEYRCINLGLFTVKYTKEFFSKSFGVPLKDKLPMKQLFSLWVEYFKSNEILAKLKCWYLLAAYRVKYRKMMNNSVLKIEDIIASRIIDTAEKSGIDFHFDANIYDDHNHVMFTMDNKIGYSFIASDETIDMLNRIIGAKKGNTNTNEDNEKCTDKPADAEKEKVNQDNRLRLRALVETYSYFVRMRGGDATTFGILLLNENIEYKLQVYMDSDPYAELTAALLYKGDIVSFERFAPETLRLIKQGISAGLLQVDDDDAVLSLTDKTKEFYLNQCKNTSKGE